jgi:two-component system, sensor histidine kinase PdtaS
MSNTIPTRESVFKAPRGGWLRLIEHERKQKDAMAAELQAARAREEALIREKFDLLARREIVAEEFEHRLLNSLQIVVSLLSLQSRTAGPEAAAHLTVAAARIASFGRVHRWLHRLDHQESVEFKQYIERLCEDISALLFQGETAPTIAVEGPEIDIPSLFATPLGFIVNELIVNSAKHARSNITVRLATTPVAGHSLSVSDDGPGLPADFDPAKSKGLGMKIIASLVRQIEGKLQIASGESGRGVRFTVIFCAPRSAANGT